jgi:hypothetical protein
MHTPLEEVKYVKGFMTKDADGRYFVDYISWAAVVQTAGGLDNIYPKYLEKVGNLIGSGLRSKDPGVQAKYLWMYDRYISAIRLVESLPGDHPYRLANPTNCTSIQALPKMARLASSARTSVSGTQQIVVKA